MSNRLMTISGRIDLVEWAQAYLYLSKKFPNSRIHNRSTLLRACISTLSEKWKQDSTYGELTVAEAYGLLEKEGIISSKSEDTQIAFLSALQSAEGQAVLEEFDSPSSIRSNGAADIPDSLLALYNKLTPDLKESANSLLRTGLLTPSTLEEWLIETVRTLSSGD